MLGPMSFRMMNQLRGLLETPSEITEADILRLYSNARLSEARDQFGRGGENHIWDKYEGGLGTWERQTGERSDKVDMRIRKMYDDQFKKSRGWSGPTGMTMIRPE